MDMAYSDANFILLIQRRTAQIAVGASALRNQGTSGFVQICRNYFERIDLQEFFDALKKESSIDYKSFLDMHTSALMQDFPENHKNNFGAARKALNLFFRDVIYNSYLTNHFLFDLNSYEAKSAISKLEVPLDNQVVTGLKEIFPSEVTGT